MGQTHETITPRLAAFLGRQPVFFVATAPSEGGHVNVSPKGLDTLRVLDERTVAYLDLTGSGVETIAHVRDNGRVTIMCCAFDGPPMILRLAGRGEVLEVAGGAADHLLDRFPPLPGARAVIVVHVDRVATSCGWGVPRMELLDDRDDLPRWAVRKGPDGLAAYHAEKNAASIDGLPGLG